MDIDFKEYGRRVTRIRKDCKLTQSDVQKKIGVSIETLRRIENGVQEPRITTLERLSMLYKYDLISLLEESRTTMSFFSDELIERAKRYVQNSNFEAFKTDLTSIIEVFAHEKNSNNTEEEQYYLQYLENIKNLTFKNRKSPQNIVINFEMLLVSLHSERSGVLTDPYLFNLECAIAIGLAIVYRSTKNDAKSIALLQPLIEKLLNYPHLTKIQINFIGTMGLNLAYAYHMLDQHEKVVETVDCIIQNNKLTFSNLLTNELYKRKAVAYFKLGIPLYQALFLTILANEKAEKRPFTCQTIKNVYQIDLGYCFGCGCKPMPS